MPFTDRQLRRAAGLVLALAVAQGAAPLAAQERSAEDTRTIDAYRLTMPVLRKVLPALYAPGAAGCERRKDRDPRTLSLTEMTAMLEQCPPVLRALGQAGVKPGDAALVLASLLRTGEQVALRSGNARALAPGAVRDNALLLEEHDAELRKLTPAGGGS